MSARKLAYGYNGWSGWTGTRIGTAAFQRFGKENGYRVKIFQEWRPGEKRERLIGPRFVELIQTLATRETDVVIVSALHAISKDLFVQDLVVWALKRRGVEVIPINPRRHLEMGYSQHDSAHLLDILDKFDTEMRLQPAKHARTALRAEQGKVEGRKAYGERDGEQQVLNRMKELRKDGLSFAAIAAELQREGFQPRGSKAKRPTAWQPRTINRILLRNVTTL